MRAKAGMPNATDLAAMAAAGAAGTLLRAVVSATLPGDLGTLVVNTSGAFALGLVWPWLPTRWRPLVITGFLGGLTTFSNLAADLAAQPLTAMVGDALLSLLLGVGAVALGWRIARRRRVGA